MRYRLMASFRGAAYQAGVGPSDEEVTLFAACPPPEELGFRSSAGHWRKRVSVEEIDALWESRPIGRYRGERCMVLDDLGDRAHIAYLGQDLYMARRLGFWEVDRGVFEVVVPRQEIDDLREERSDYELTVVDDGDGAPMDRDPRGQYLGDRNPGDRDARDWDPRGTARYAPGPRDTGFLAPGARMDRSPMERGLMDTGPSRAADPRIMRDESWADRDAAWVDGDGGGWADRDASAQDPRDTGTWAALRDADFREPPEPGGPYPRGRGGWRARDTGGWERPDTGTWDAREVAEMAAREEARTAAAQAAAREAAARDGRGLADTAAWDAREMNDTGGWDAREVNARAGTGRDPRHAASTGAWDRRDAAGTGGWDARDMNGRAPRDGRDPADTGGWDARDMNGRAPRDPADTGGWDARDMAGAGGWPAAETNGRSARDAADTGGWPAGEATGTGNWPAADINGRTARDPADVVAWDAREMSDTSAWAAREMDGRLARDARNAGARPEMGEWDARDPAAGSRREIGRWDPQETVVWDPVDAGEWDQSARPRGGGLDARPGPGWEPAEVVPLQPRTPDAAAVWHGSPAPEDAGLWNPPEPVNPPVTPPRLAIAGSPVPVQSPEPQPGSRPEPTSGFRLESAYREQSAYNGPPAPAAPGPDGAAWPDVVRPHPEAHVAAETPVADPVVARNSATPSEYAAIAGRSVGRRSARKARVTTQAIFSQLLELASIPQSAYAVDDEVDGAMCLIRAKGGYEVFSLADQSRHEVRFFDDEEAAYFYLFGILAAEAVRSGYLGPNTPSGQRNGDSPDGTPPARG